MNMMITPSVQRHWTAIRPIFAIRNEREYEQAVERLNRLIDDVGSDESHPLYELLDTLGTVIHAYEERHYPMPESGGAEALAFLMEEHGLRQADLPEIGSQGVVSEILNGRRQLNIRQIRLLAKRFGVSTAVFI
jgi:HTH-type transcriptional regulator/antitoxin HigA